MNINSGMFLAGGDLIVFTDGYSIYISYQDGKLHTIASRYGDIHFLTASSYGEYLAFWSFSGDGSNMGVGESFFLIDLSGKQIWSAWMNSDKCVPVGTGFSNSGNALACFYHFEGCPGIFFCDVDNRLSTIFGCSGRPIGHDAGLRYFALTDYDRDEMEKPGFYEKDTISGNILKLSPDVVMNKFKTGPILVDRNRCILPDPRIPVPDWQGLIIQDNLSGYIILRNSDLCWYARDSNEPDVTIKQCILEEDRNSSFNTLLSSCEDNVLIQTRDRFTVANRNNGVVWRGKNLSCVTLKGKRAIAQYTDGQIEVIKDDGSIEISRRGLPVIAADISDNVLTIAYFSNIAGRLKVETFNLSK